MALRDIGQLVIDNLYKPTQPVLLVALGAE